MAVAAGPVPGAGRGRVGLKAMLAFWRAPRFDPDLLSSIWVMACRDESPVVTAFSIAYRLGRNTTPTDVMELVKGRRELFRLGLTPAQSRAWKERYRELAADGTAAPPASTGQPRAPDLPPVAGKDEERKQGKDGPAKQERDGQGQGGKERARQPPALPDWLRVFDDEGPQADQERVRAWLGDTGIATSGQALERFLDRGFVIDEAVIRSVFRLEPGLDAEPSDLATVNWGLEHLERLRRGRAETRQSLVALTTGIGGVAIGALVALTAPMVTTIYQGRPLDTNRLTIDHQMLVTGYGGLAAATAGARHAARARDPEALAKALAELDKAAASILPLVADRTAREDLRARRREAAEACAGEGALAQACPAALDRLQALLDGRLADLVAS
ncbi:MAG: hypothetical protein U1E17_08850 [Geminicoccaceae bacterium]